MTTATPPEKTTDLELINDLEVVAAILTREGLTSLTKSVYEAARRLPPRVGDVVTIERDDVKALSQVIEEWAAANYQSDDETALGLMKKLIAAGFVTPRALSAPPAASADEPPSFDDATLAEFARECTQINNRMPHKLKLVALSKDWLALREANEALMKAVFDYALDEVERKHFARYAPKGKDDMNWICRLFRCSPRGRANTLLVYARDFKGRRLMSKFAFIAGEKGLRVSLTGFNTKSGKTDALFGVPLWTNDNPNQPMTVAADGMSADFPGTGAPISGNIHVTAEGDAVPGVDALATDFVVAETAEEADSLQVSAEPLA